MNDFSMTDTEISDFIDIIIKMKKWEKTPDRILGLEEAIKSGSWDDYLFIYRELNNKFKIEKLESEQIIKDLTKLMLKQ